MTKNILFIMFDQLRWDYLSCAGHKTLETPNIDWLASRGIRFTRTYVQSPTCGAARMSYYTGRYVHSHGAAHNNFPLKVGEQTMGDHLRKCGMDSWLIGKTHMKADSAGMERLGISRDSKIGSRVEECGFDVFIRDDCLWGQGPDGFYDEKRSPYNEYLKSKGYEGENPWANNANAGITDTGDIASGWLLKNANKPANIKEEDSETPWLTSRALDFMEMQDLNSPWLAHISYIKPHWPYIVPKPYHQMYGHNQIQPIVRSDSERVNPHPVFKAYQNNSIGKAFQRDEVRDVVIPAYMGLIKQCDDQMGRLFTYLKDSGALEDTIIVLTSDHGDYLGDHWLGEKDLFHEASVKVPLIVYDPSKDADVTRGTVCDELVESIDLVATFIDYAGGVVPDHIVEGKSLKPFIKGKKLANWREFAISEFDYSCTSMADNLSLKPKEARLFMVADKKWKFMHSEGPDHPVMLFDLINDPDELIDLGVNPDYKEIIDMMYERLGRWARRASQRETKSDNDIIIEKGISSRKGIVFGAYDGTEIDEEELVSYRGKANKNYIN
jgi:arylsulfatase A-like enzyme